LCGVSQGPDCPADGDENIYRGLQAGAKGYLLKDAEPEELLAAIRAVFEGKKYIPLAVGVKLAARLSGSELSERSRIRSHSPDRRW